MTDYKSLYDFGWKKETSFGNAFTALAAGETACYKFGDQVKPGSIGLKMDYNRFWKRSSFDYEALSSGKFGVDFNLPFRLMDALPLFFAMGKSTDGTDGATKTHALSGSTPADALPSFVLHYKATDISASTPIYKDVFGCRVNKLTLESSMANPVDCTLQGYGLDWADGNNITAGIALKPTAVNTMFHMNHCTFSWNSADIPSLIGWKLEYLNNIALDYTDGQTPVYRPKYLERRDAKRLIGFFLICHLDTKTLIDEIRAQAERTFTITIQRTDANDKITLTFATSIIESAPLQIPAFNGENIYTLIGFAKTLTAAVRDAIATY